MALLATADISMQQQQRQLWRSQGLPPDALAGENAAIIAATGAFGMRTPLVVDPAGQAVAWLRAHLCGEALGAASMAFTAPASTPSTSAAAAPLDVVAPSDSRFAQTVELAVRFGHTLLVNECCGGEGAAGAATDAALPRLLMPLLRRDFVRAGPRQSVRLGAGDRSVDVDSRFRLLLSTRTPQLHLPPDVAALVTPVSFTVTRAGLQAQLLSAAVAHEAPRLEAHARALQDAHAAARAALTRAEAALLAALAAGGAALLEDEHLLTSLAGTRAAAAALADARRAAVDADAALDATRGALSALASVAGELIFSLGGLAHLSPAYAVSLRFFVRLFGETMRCVRPAAAALTGEDGGALDAAAVSALADDLLRRAYFAVAGGLMREHQLAAALYLAVRTRPALFSDDGRSVGGGMASAGWRHLIGEGATMPAAVAAGSGGAGAMTTAASAPMPVWVPPDRVPHLRALLCALPGLAPPVLLADAGGASAAGWARWLGAAAPEAVGRGGSGGGSSGDGGAALPVAISAFHRTLLLLALRPDRAASALAAFVCTAVLRLPAGASLAPPAPALGRLHEDEGDDARTPILLLAGAGTDPGAELAAAAAATATGGLDELALGGGDDDTAAIATALAALARAAGAGRWLALHNVHLAPAGLAPALERALAALPAATPAGFRLWLTTEPPAASALPPGLLRAARKAVLEAPPGVRASVQRTLDMWGAARLAGGGAARAQLLAALAWLHAQVCERRAFGAQGWRSPHEFGAADLRAAAAALDAQLVRAGGAGGGVPWAFVHGLLELSAYGGRIGDAHDARTLRALLAAALHPDVLRGARALAPGAPPPPPSESFVALAGAGSWAASLPPPAGDADAPATLGLPDNIGASVQRAAAAAAAHALRAMQGCATASGATAASSAATAAAAAAFDRAAWPARLAPVLTAGAALAAATASYGLAAAATAVAADPLSAFVRAELRLVDDLAATAARDLAAIAAALAPGAPPPPPPTLAVARALLAGQVPDSWAPLAGAGGGWEGAPDRAMPWLRGLAARAAALRRGWCGRPPAHLLSQPLRLADLVRPAAFLQALRQHTARALRAAAPAAAPAAALDDLRLVAVVGDARAALSGAPLPVTLRGLHLQGAVWAAATLRDAAAGAPELQLLPDVAAAWLPPACADPLDAAAAILVPIYATPARAHVVANLALPCRSAAERLRWVLAGVAASVEGHDD